MKGKSRPKWKVVYNGLKKDQKVQKEQGGKNNYGIKIYPQIAEGQKEKQGKKDKKDR